jgi:hypothetical protein
VELRRTVARGASTLQSEMERDRRLARKKMEGSVSYREVGIDRIDNG